MVPADGNVGEGVCQARVIIAPARNMKARPKMVRSLGRREFPTSSSIANSATNSRSLTGAVVTNLQGSAKSLRFLRGFPRASAGVLPTCRHFRCSHRLQARLLQHGIRAGQILILKIRPTCQRFFRSLVPLLVRRNGIGCGGNVGTLHNT